MPHLTSLTDPLAIDMENGERVIYENLTEDFSLSSVCFLSAVTEAGGTYDISSLYRPQEYQQHLIEVWDRYRDIMRGDSDLNTPECSALRNEIIAEYQGHGLQDTQRPVTNSAHTRGTAMDVTTTLPAGYDVDTLANNCGLYRPSPVRDPGHFQLQ